MKPKTTLLAFAAAALLTAGPALAGPNCANCPNKNKGGELEEPQYEVADREGKAEGDRKAERGEKRKAERGERGDRRERGERAERRERRSPMQALGLSKDQQAQAKEIFEASREQAQAVMARVKEARENGDEVDREAVRERLMAIRKDAMDKVYNTVLNDEQKAKVDERRKKMEERRAKREAEGGERGEREGKKKRKGGEDGERPERNKKRGGDDGLDL